MKLFKIINVVLVLLATFLGYHLIQFYRLVRVKIGVQESAEMEPILFLYNLIWVILGLILIGLVAMLIMGKKVSNKSSKTF